MSEKKQSEINELLRAMVLYTLKMAQHEPGTAPSVGYFQELIEEAREIEKKIKELSPLK